MRAISRVPPTGFFFAKRPHARNLPTLARPDHAQGCQAFPCSINLAKAARALATLCPHLPKNRPRLPSLSMFHEVAHSLPKAARPWHHPTNTCPHFASSGPRPDRAETSGQGWGRDRIGATWAESQWIVAARPLCHLQYPVAYLSRLQRILPAARREFLQGVPCDSSAARVSPTTRAFGGRGPYCWSANGRRAHASLLARILT